MFVQRLISGILLVLVLAFLLISGGTWLWAGLFIISEIGIFELARVFSVEKSILAAAGYIAAAAWYLNMRLSFCDDVMLIISVFLLIVLAIYVFTYPKFHFDQIGAVFFAFFYVAVMLSYIYRVRSLDQGILLVWLVIICSWGCDTCAYCSGMLFGKHKMTPLLSPKKTIEGAVGGVLGAVILSMIFGLCFSKQLSFSGGRIAIMAIASCACSLLSMVGDLAASAIKRNYEIKDYGNLIPGHGGILDRFDSVIITAPLLYYILSGGF